MEAFRARFVHKRTRESRDNRKEQGPYQVLGIT